MLHLRVAAIIEDPFLANLVETAFSVYLSSEVTFFDSYDSYSGQKDQFNLIVVTTGNKDRELERKLSGENAFCGDCIILGTSKASKNNIHFLSNSDLILEMTRLVAKIFSISAKELATIQAQQKYRIPKDLLYVGLKVPCPVYAEITEESDFQLCSAEKVLDAAFFEMLNMNKTSYVKIPAEFRVTFFKLVCDNFKGLMPKLVGSADVHKQVSGAHEFLIENFKGQPMNKEALVLSQQMMSVTLETVKSVNSVNSLLQSLFRDTDSFRYQHSCLTTYFCALIVENTEYGNEKQKELLGFVALFHDMFLQTDEQMKIHSDSQVKKLESEKERKLLDLHAQICARYFDKVDGIPMGVTNILREHHGVHNGKGYDPKSLKLSNLSIVFAIAEFWSKSLLMLGSEESGRNIHRALTMTRNKFDHLLPFRQILHKLDDSAIKGKKAA